MPGPSDSPGTCSAPLVFKNGPVVEIGEALASCNDSLAIVFDLERVQLGRMAKCETRDGLCNDTTRTTKRSK